MKIHEATKADGTLAPIFLRRDEDGDGLALEDDEGARALPKGAVDAVMTRFGAPLESEERVAEIARLDLGDGRTLRHVRHLARYDVIAKDYIVYEKPDAEPLCALATTVAAALSHLAHATSR